jgi:phage gp36-like protein
MAYTSQTLLERAFSAGAILRLTDDEKAGSIGALALARITEAITQASHEVDAYCRKHYSVPFATTPPIVETLATSLAGYYLFRRRMAEVGLPDEIKDLRADAIKQLESISKGILELGVEPPPASSAGVVAESSGPAAIFTSTTLVDF